MNTLLSSKQGVAGSNPTISTNFFRNALTEYSVRVFLFLAVEKRATDFVPAVALPGASLFIEGHAPQTPPPCGLSASGLHLGAAFAMIRVRRKD